MQTPAAPSAPVTDPGPSEPPIVELQRQRLVVDLGGAPSPYSKGGPPADHTFVDQAVPCMASMVQLIGLENVYVISIVGPKDGTVDKQHIMACLCQDTVPP